MNAAIDPRAALARHDAALEAIRPGELRPAPRPAPEAGPAPPEADRLRAELDAAAQRRGWLEAEAARLARELAESEGRAAGRAATLLALRRRLDGWAAEEEGRRAAFRERVAGLTVGGGGLRGGP